jgi:small basic protein
MPLLKYATGNADLDNNTVALKDLIDRIKDIPLVGGRLITGIQLAAATNVDVPHLLGRPFRGWAVVDMLGAVTGGVINRVNAAYDTKRFLRLNAVGFGATVTIAMWVF